MVVGNGKALQYCWTGEATAPPPELLDLARRIVSKECPKALYVRVDCVRQHGHWAMMELELLEPSLYLAHEPGAAARWAESLLHRLSE